MTRSSLPIFRAVVLVLGSSIFAACGEGGGGTGGGSGQPAGAGGGPGGGNGGNGTAGLGGASRSCGRGRGGAARLARVAGGATGSAGWRHAGRGGAAGARGGDAAAGAAARPGRAPPAAAAGGRRRPAGGRRSGCRRGRRPAPAGGGGAAGTGAAGAAGTPGPLPAFPGADGAAARITGGRGGDVYHVTMLDTDFSDMTAGHAPLRPDERRPRPRTIVFDVSGVFSLGPHRGQRLGLERQRLGHGVAAEHPVRTSPSPARPRPGPSSSWAAGSRPAATTSSSATSRSRRATATAASTSRRSRPRPATSPTRTSTTRSTSAGTNVMIDHVTTIYATDETISMNELANNVTIQYCNISQGQNYPQARRRVAAASLHGARARLAAAGGVEREDQRPPQPVRPPEGAAAARRDRGRCADRRRRRRVQRFPQQRLLQLARHRGHRRVGAAEPEQLRRQLLPGGRRRRQPVGRHQHRDHARRRRHGDLQRQRFDADQGLSLRQPQGHQQGRRRQRRDRAGQQRLRHVRVPGAARYTQTPYYGVTETAPVAFERVLDYAGARWWSRGAVDQRAWSARRAPAPGESWPGPTIRSTAARRKGPSGARCAPTPMTSRPAGFDTDSDGMPERLGDGARPEPDGRRQQRRLRHRRLHEPRGVHQRDRRVARDRGADLRRRAQHALRGHPKLAMVRNGRGQIGNAIAAYWQPSRCDSVEIRGGRAVVDAVGQHAGNLEVAAAARSPSGRLARRRRRSGLGARGMLALAGGRLAAGELRSQDARAGGRRGARVARRARRARRRPSGRRAARARGRRGRATRRRFMDPADGSRRRHGPFPLRPGRLRGHRRHDARHAHVPWRAPRTSAAR